MNILFITLDDFNSINKKGIYTDLLREFEKNKHNLYIISPTEKKFKQATKLIEKNKVKILKLQIGNTQKTNLIEKGISTLTTESKIIDGIKKYFNDVKFDLILYSTPPITVVKPIEFVKKRDGAQTYLMLKDIFPQNAVDLGMLRTTGPMSLIYNHFRKKEKKLYQISDYIGCMSMGNVKYLIENNPEISNQIVEVCPNSIEPFEIILSDKEKKRIREKYNLPFDKTVFIYGGNLGKPQGIDFLIECIKLNEKNENSFFLITGSGTEYKKIHRYFEKNKPINARLMSEIPKPDYEILANSCDVGLIFLDHRFTIPNFPSRLLSYQQASMPVLAATDPKTDIGRVIEDGGFGYWCESNDKERFNKFVNLLCDNQLRQKKGKASRKYLENNYTAKHSYEVIMRHFIECEGRKLNV